MNVFLLGLCEVQLRCKTNQTNTTKSSDDSNSDDNGGFITPPPTTDNNNKQNRLQNQVKRATVVENPMFSNSPDSSGADICGPTESLGLDDLDMDYEQIMHYFDNLKVRK